MEKACLSSNILHHIDVANECSMETFLFLVVQELNTVTCLKREYLYKTNIPLLL